MSQRIKTRRLELRSRYNRGKVSGKTYTQAYVARLVGVSAPTVTQWEAGDQKPRGENLIRLATALDTTPDYLLSGSKRGPEFKTNGRSRTLGDVPVMLKENLISSKEDDATKPKEYIPACPVTHGPDSYAWICLDDSMQASSGKSYPKNCYTYVDPDQSAHAKTGDRVLAKVGIQDGNEDIVFRQYIEQGSKSMLVALNSSYPPIDSDFEIIGKVIGKFEPE